MKPLPPPDVPGKTEFQKFDNAVREVLTVSKDELLKREERERVVRIYSNGSIVSPINPEDEKDANEYLERLKQIKITL